MGSNTMEQTVRSIRRLRIQEDLGTSLLKAFDLCIGRTFLSPEGGLSLELSVSCTQTPLVIIAILD